MLLLLTRLDELLILTVTVTDHFWYSRHWYWSMYIYSAIAAARDLHMRPTTSQGIPGPSQVWPWGIPRRALHQSWWVRRGREPCTTRGGNGGIAWICQMYQMYNTPKVLKPWKLFGNVGLTAKQCVFWWREKSQRNLGLGKPLKAHLPRK